MSPLARLALLALASSVDGDRGTRFVDASLEPGGEILSARFHDVDLDGQVELVLALRRRDGGRELRFHRLKGTELAREPYHTIEVLDDAVAYGLADVRPEPGREVFFLTRGGAWSYSLTHPGFRDNLTRLVSAELLYDVPEPDDFPWWPYVFPGEGGEWLLLPTIDDLLVWTPPAAGTSPEEAGYRLALEQALAPPRVHAGETEEDTTQVAFGPAGLSIRKTGGTLPPLFVAPDGGGGALLRHDRDLPAPAVVDLDGDGRLDLLRKDSDGLHVHLADRSGRFEATPTRVEPLPKYLQADDDEELDLWLHDLNLDGRMDVVARHEGASRGLDSKRIDVLVLLNDGRRLLPEEPTQVLRFEAAELRVHVGDVDGDGRPDLALRKFELPSLMDTLSGLEFKLTHLLHLGEKGALPFARKPVMKQERTYDENSLTEAIRNRALELDHDGDGIADLVEIDFEGRIAIRRIRKSSSFFGGTTWSLEETPWVRFEVNGEMSSIEVEDLNRDGLGDVVSHGRRTLTLLLSDRR